MRGRILKGSTLLLAILVSNNKPATARDWTDCGRCGGYGYYSGTGSAYDYYTWPTYAYAPADYYPPTCRLWLLRASRLLCGP
jgi:hypothetical protein